MLQNPSINLQCRTGLGHNASIAQLIHSLSSDLWQSVPRLVEGEATKIPASVKVLQWAAQFALLQRGQPIGPATEMPNPIATYHDLIRRDVTAMISEHAGRVLDFGGGVGATSLWLKNASKADHIVLLDQVADKALEGIDHALSLDLNDIELVGDALFDIGPFDTILCLDVLEHLIDPWAVVALLEGALRPGGTIIVSLPNANHHSLSLSLLVHGRFDYADAGLMDKTHLRWFTKATMCELATRGKLRLDAIEPNISGRRDTWLNILTFGLLERFFAKQYRMALSKPQD